MGDAWNIIGNAFGNLGSPQNSQRDNLSGHHMNVYQRYLEQGQAQGLGQLGQLGQMQWRSLQPAPPAFSDAPYDWTPGDETEYQTYLQQWKA
jgi:hypothetical protein